MEGGSEGLSGGWQQYMLHSWRYRTITTQSANVCPSTSCPPICEEFEPGAGRQTGGRTGVSVCVCVCMRACK